MELALLHLMLIIYCVAFANLEFNIRTSASIRNDRPLPDNDKKVVYFIKWLIIWEILVGIYCKSSWWNNIVDWEKIYISKEPYRIEFYEHEMDRITKLSGNGEKGIDKNGEYERIHLLERYRVSRNSEKWLDTLDMIVNRYTEDSYDVEVTNDNVYICEDGIREATAEWKCESVFGYIYIEWDYRLYMNN